MFESITIKSTYDKPLNIGLLLESLIFYSSVNLVLGEKSLNSIVDNLELLKFLNDIGRTSKLNLHLVSANRGISHYKDQYSITSLSIEEKSPFIFETIYRKHEEDEERLNTIYDFWGIIESYCYSQDVNNEHQDIFNDKVLHTAIDSVLKYNFPNIKNFDDAYIIGDRNYIDERERLFKYDLLFDDKITNGLTESEISMLVAQPVSAISDVNINMRMASKFKSDFISDSIYEALLKTKLHNITTPLINETSPEIKLFQDVIVENNRSIEKAINEKFRTIAEYISLYNESQKFTSWLTNLDPDSNAIKEYFKEINSKQWFDKLPGKTVRWSFFTGTGLLIDALGGGGLGTLAGMAISAGDSFYLDKILSGWKPNLFIDNNLNEFVKE